MTARDIEATDAQVHVWKESTPERPWNTKYADNPHGPANMPAEVVATDMDDAGVSAAIVVPTSFEGDRNDLALEASHNFPERFRMHGRFPLDDSAVAPIISDALRDPAMLGLRLTFNAAASTWLDDDTLEWFWEFASEESIPVSLYPLEHHLPLIGEVAHRYPRVKITIDHLATSIAKYGFDTFDRINQLEPLGRYTNVAVKASALPVSFPTTYSAELVATLMGRLLDWFGPKRIFWGSDYTRMHKPADYGETLQLFRQGIAELPDAEQRLLLGEGVREWFDWTA